MLRHGLGTDLPQQVVETVSRSNRMMTDEDWRIEWVGERPDYRFIEVGPGLQLIAGQRFDDFYRIE